MSSQSPNKPIASIGVLQDPVIFQKKKSFLFCCIFILATVTITKQRSKQTNQKLNEKSLKGWECFVSLLLEFICQVKISKDTLSLAECYHQC